MRQSDFTLTGKLGQMLYVSNAGDLILISLGEKDTIRLYSRAGTLAKSWDLKEILSKDEIQSCAKTGATLQWIDEGSFHDRTFYCHGPSRLIRALKPPYTVLRGANVKVTFSATLNAENARLTKHASDQ